MALNPKLSTRLQVGSFALAATVVLVMSFQNCSKVGFVQSKDTLQSLQATSQTVYTDLNTPKTFEAVFSDKAPGVYPSFDDGAKAKTLKSGSTVAIADLEKSTFTYQPALGFRGSESLTLHLKDNYGNATTNFVTFVVANPLHELQPAMAIRTPGCISCHAQVASSFITDFGAGDPYFFAKNLIPQGQNPLQGAGTSMYADRMDSNIAWSSAKYSGAIILPKVQFGFDLGLEIQKILDSGEISSGLVASAQAMRANSSPTHYLADYIRAAEAQKPSSSYGLPSNAAGVVERDTVYIGAPSVEVLKARTQIGAERSKFFKNSEASPELSGLIDHGTYFEASSLTCDGDLVLNLPIYLKTLKVKTDMGCRIYSTQSIFVNGTVTYEQINPGAEDLTNLQLVSSEWVNFGVGLTHCESTANPGWFSAGNMTQTPFNMRLQTYVAPTRAATDTAAMTSLSSKLKSEETLIAGFKDASCETPQAGTLPRDVGYSRMLVNAPRVDSRYTGQFRGVLISEVALFGLSTFAYTYDPVFNSVPILPFLETKDYLNVK